MFERTFKFRIVKIGAVLCAAALLCGVNAFASGITYHGRLLNPDSTPVTDSSVQFKMDILTPDSQSCLMYEELQTKNLSSTLGAFSITINDGTGTRTDSSGLTFDQVFGNIGTLTFAPATCSSGTGSYTPATGDGRTFQVYFKTSTMSTWEPMPAQSINFSPFAIEAKQVSGFPAASLLRVQQASGAPGTATPLSPTDFSNLQTLLAGTSTQYVQSGTNGAPIPSMSSNPGTPSAGDIWFNSTSKTLDYYDGTAVQTVGTGSGAGTVTSVATGTGLTGGPITSSGTISLATVGTAGTYTKVTTDAYGRVTAGTQITGNDITSGTIGGSTSMSTTGSVSAASVSSTTDSTNNLWIYEGTNTHKVKITAPASLSADYGLTLPTTEPAANGYMLISDTSGNLSWAAPSGGSVTSVAMTVPSILAVTGSPITTSGTLAVTLANETANTVFAAPNGSTGAPSFRTLAAADIPNLDWSKITTGLPTTLAGYGITDAVKNAGGAVSVQEGADTSKPAAGTAGRIYIASDTFKIYRDNGTSWDLIASTLTTTGATGAYINGGNSFGQAATLGTNDGYTLGFKTNGTTQMTIDTAGNVGIGTTTPSYTLDANGRVNAASASGAGGFISTGNLGGTGSAAYFPLGLFTATGNNNWLYGTNYFDGVLTSNTGGAWKIGKTGPIYFNNGSNVGIGTASPGYPLEIDAAVSTGYGGVLKIRNSTANQFSSLSIFNDGNVESGAIGVGNSTAAIFSNSMFMGTVASEPLYLMTTGTQRVSIDQSGNLSASALYVQYGGNVGIGTTSPTAALQLKAGVAAAGGAPLKLTAGTSLTSPEPGAIEYDGTSLFYTDSSSVRHTLAAAGSGITALTGDVTASGSGSVAATLATTGVTAATYGSATQVPQIAVDAKGRITSASNVSIPTATGAQLGLMEVGSGLNVASGVVSLASTGATGAYLNGGNSFGQAATLGTNDANSLGFLTNGTTQMTIDTAGHVGIGTTSPGSALEVNGEIAADKDVLVGSSATETYASSSSSGQYPMEFGSYNGLIKTYNSTNSDQNYTSLTMGQRNTAGNWQWASIDAVSVTGAGSYSPAITFTQSTGSNAYAERMRIDQNGNVGIGTTSPGAQLTIGPVVSTSPATSVALQDYDSTTNQARYVFNTGGNWGALGELSNGSIFLGFTTSPSGYPVAGTPLVVTQTGNVGIGTTTPSNLLDLSSTTAYAGLTIEHLGTTSVLLAGNNASDDNGLLDLLNGGAIGVQLLASGNSYFNGGNVGIGTTSPTAALQLKAGVAAAGGAPLKLTAGTSLTTPEPGAIEYDGTSLFYTDSSSVRHTLAAAGGGITALTGDVTASGSGSVAATLATTGVTAATYGSATQVPQIAVDAKGRITSASNVSIPTATGAQLGLMEVGSGLSVASGVVSLASTGATGAYLNGGNSFGQAATLGTNDAYTLGLKTNGSTQMTIDTAGNVGIGSATPTGKLDVEGSGNIYLNAGQVGIGKTSNLSGSSVYIQANSSNSSVVNGLVVDNSNGGGVGADLTLTSDYASGSNSNGDVSGQIDFKGSNSALVMKPTAQIRSNFTNVTSGSEQGSLSFATTNAGALSDRMTITSAGNVGIGTTNPQYAKLQIGNGSSITGMALDIGAGGFSQNNGQPMYVGGPIYWVGNGTDSLTFDNNGVTFTTVAGGNYIFSNGGSVGIGTTSPTAALQLKAGVAAAGGAPLKLTAGTSLTTPEPGAIEYDGTSLFYTDSSSVRHTLAAAGAGITALTGDVTASGSGSVAATLATTGVTAATYGSATQVPQIAVDAKGRITSASNVSIPTATGAQLGLMEVGSGLSVASGVVSLASTGATGAYLNGGNSFGQAATLGTNDAYTLGFKTNGSTQMTIDTAGNVGIGTSTPGFLLDIWSGGNRAALIAPGGETIWGQYAAHLGNGTAYTPTSAALAAPSQSGLAVSSDAMADGSYEAVTVTARNAAATYQTAYLAAVSNSTGTTPALVIGQQTGATSYAERMRIDQNGNVGIGTISPSVALDVGSGAVSAGSGSQTAPSYEFGGAAAETGFFLAGANTIGWTGSGTQAGDFTSAGVNTESYGVGFGSFSSKMSGNSVGSTADYINFFTDSAERLRINGSGNVGIGTTSPTAALQLKAGVAAAGGAPLKLTAGTSLTTPEPGAIEYDGTSLFYTDSSSVRHTLAAAGSGITALTGDVTASGSGSVAATLATTGVTAATYGSATQVPQIAVDAKGRITSASNVSIPTATGAQLGLMEVGSGLSVASGVVSLASTGATGAYLNGGNSFGQAATLGTNDAYTLGFKTNGSTQMTIDTAGNVGIGTATPANKLDVNGGVAVGTYAGSAAPANGLVVSGVASFGTYGGTGTSGAQVIVEQNSTNSGGLNGLVVQNQNAGVAGADLIISHQRGSTALQTNDLLGQIDFKGDDSANSYMLMSQMRSTLTNATSGSVSSNLVFSTANNSTVADRMVITGAGNVGIGTASPSQVLDVNGNVNVGSNVYASGNFTSTGGMFVTGGQNMTQVLISSSGTDYGTIQNDAGNTWSLGHKTTATTALGTPVLTWTAGGDVGIGTTSPTAALQLRAGVAAAGGAPLKLTAGTSLTTPEPGAIEYDGTSLFYTDSASVRHTLAAAGSGITALTGDVTASGSGSVAATLATTGVTAATYGSATQVPQIAVDAKGRITSASNVSIQTATTGQLGLMEVGSGLSVASGVVSLASTGATGAYLNGGNSFGQAATLGTNDAYTLGFKTNGSTQMTIDTAGNVGIGTASPGFLLDVNGMARINNMLLTTQGAQINTSDATVYAATGAGNYPTGTSGHVQALNLGSSIDGSQSLLEFAVKNAAGNIQNAYIDSVSTTGAGSYSPIIAIGVRSNSTNYAERMRIDQNGNVGIGTTSPGALLDVHGAAIINTSATVWGGVLSSEGSAATPGYRFGLDTNTGIFDPGSHILGFSTNGAENMRIDAAGHVGIGTTSPTAALQLKAGVAAAGGAPLKLTAGTSLTTPEPGAIEYDGTSLFYTDSSSVRHALGSGGSGITALTGDVTASGSGSVAATLATTGVTAATYGSATQVPQIAVDAKGRITSASNVSIQTATTGQLGLMEVGSGLNVAAGVVSLSSTGATGAYLNGGNSFGQAATLGTNDAHTLGFKTNGTTQMTIDTAGNVGIGTTSPSGLFDVEAGFAAITLNSGLLDFFTVGGNAYSASSSSSYFPNENLTLNDNTGGDGIGTLIQFNTGGNSSGNPQNAWIGAVTEAGAGVYAPDIVFGHSTGASSYSEFMRINTIGDVGIGTTSPSTKLDLYVPTQFDGLTLRNASNVIALLQGEDSTPSNDSGSLTLFSQGVANVQILSNGNETYFNGGNVGIGTVSPSYPLDVVGDIRTSTCLHYASSTLGTCSSDERLKKDIKPYKLGLKELVGIDPVTFKYNGLGGNPDDGKTQVGVIAQQVEKVAPQLVGIKKLKLHPDDKSPTVTKTVDYGAFTYMIINAVKTLYKQLTGVVAHQTAQDRDLASLKSDYKQIEADNARLKASDSAKDQKIKELERENQEMNRRLEKIEQMLKSK